MNTPEDKKSTASADTAGSDVGAAPRTQLDSGSPASQKPAIKAAKTGDKAAPKASAAPKTASGEPDAKADAGPNPQSVEVFPLRSYQDAGEIKRRGGPGYTVPRRHAEALIAGGLASTDKPATKPSKSDK